MIAKQIHTVNGPVDPASLGLILPHEHLFTDLRGPSVDGYAQGDPSKVMQVVGPYLNEAAEAGVTALVECSTLGVGRNLSVLRALAESTPIRIIARPGCIVRHTSRRPCVRAVSMNWQSCGRRN
jgi:phosphotriesterase-related protein